MMQPIMEDHTTPSPRQSTEKLLSSSSSTSSTLGRFSNNDSDDERSGIPDWPLRGVGSQRHRRLRAFAVVGILVTSILLNIVLVICMLHRGWSVKKVVETSLAKPMLYSPANEVLETVLVKFDTSIYDGTTPYQGRPNEQNNKLWMDLWNHERTHLSPEQAMLLPNKTLPEKAAPGKYVVLLNVFHNLHCLDSLRLALYYFLDDKWTAEENPYVLMGKPGGGGDINGHMMALGGMDNGVVHLDHCIDVLRQQEMCLPDVTPNVFQYSPWDKGIRAFSGVVHECRNFHKIKEWARKNRSPPWEGWGDGEALGKCSSTDQGDDCLYR